MTARLLLILILGLAGVVGCRSESRKAYASRGLEPPGDLFPLRIVVVWPPGMASATANADAEGLNVALFTDPREWPSGTAAFRRRTPFVEGRGEATFEHLPEGAYAIVAFVDLDGDGELDRGAFGVPTEPIAYGNDAKPRFGPPSFDACVVEVGRAAREVTLTLVVE